MVLFSGNDLSSILGKKETFFCGLTFGLDAGAYRSQ